MKAIIAVNKANYIGLNDTLPWRSSEDLKHFKAMTLGKKLLVGRTTFESLPPLKDREIIVVGTGHNTLEEALNQKPDFVIGGKRLYETTLHLCDELHISEINDKTKGDTLAPDLNLFKGQVFVYKFNVNKPKK
jgi:dihydrofolate reductase